MPPEHSFLSTNVQICSSQNNPWQIAACSYYFFLLQIQLLLSLSESLHALIFFSILMQPLSFQHRYLIAPFFGLHLAIVAHHLIHQKYPSKHIQYLSGKRNPIPSQHHESYEQIFALINHFKRKCNWWKWSNFPHECGLSMPSFKGSTRKKNSQLWRWITLMMSGLLISCIILSNCGTGSRLVGRERYLTDTFLY